MAVGLLGRLAAATDAQLTSWPTLNLFRAAVDDPDAAVFGGAQTSDDGETNRQVFGAMILCHAGCLGAFLAVQPWGRWAPGSVHRAALGAAAVGFVVGLVGALMLVASPAAAVQPSSELLAAYLTTLAAVAYFIINAVLLVLGVVLTVPELVIGSAGLLVLGAHGGLFALDDMFYVRFFMREFGDDAGADQVRAGFVLLWTGVLGLLLAALLYLLKHGAPSGAALLKPLELPGDAPLKQGPPARLTWVLVGVGAFVAIDGVALLFYNVHGRTSDQQVSRMNVFETFGALFVLSAVVSGLLLQRSRRAPAAALLLLSAAVVLLRLAGHPDGMYSGWAHGNLFCQSIQADTGISPVVVHGISRKDIDQTDTVTKGVAAGFIMAQLGAVLATVAALVPVRRVGLEKGVLVPGTAVAALGVAAGVLLWIAEPAAVQNVETDTGSTSYFLLFQLASGAVLMPLLALMAINAGLPELLGVVATLAAFRGVFFLSATFQLADAPAGSDDFALAGGIMAWAVQLALVWLATHTFADCASAAAPALGAVLPIV